MSQLILQDMDEFPTHPLVLLAKERGYPDDQTLAFGQIVDTEHFILVSKENVHYSEGFPLVSEHTPLLYSMSLIAQTPLARERFTFKGVPASLVLEDFDVSQSSDDDYIRDTIEAGIKKHASKKLETSLPELDEKSVDGAASGEEVDDKNADVEDESVEADVPEDDEQVVFDSDTYENMQCGVSYDDYVATIFDNTKPDDFKKIYTIIDAFLNMQDIGLVRVIDTKFDLFNTMLYDTVEFKKAYDRYRTMKIKKVLNKARKDLSFSENIKTANTMGKVPQSETKGEAFVKVSSSSLSGEAVYLNPYVEAIQRVPVVKETKTLYHALVNEQVHDIVCSQVKTVLGDNAASAMPQKSLILKSLTPALVNELSDVQIVSYADDKLCIGVQFNTQGVQATGMKNQLLERRVIPYLAFKMAFGQPSYYNLLYAIKLDADLRKDMKGKVRNAIRVRRSKTEFPGMFEKMRSVREVLVSFSSEDKPFFPASGKVAFPPSYQSDVSTYLSSMVETRKNMISDRSAFVAFYKYFTGDMTESLLHRAANDLIAVNSDLICKDSLEYVRNGRVLTLLNQRVRPMQHPDDEVLLSTAKLEEEFLSASGSNLFRVDYSNCNVIIHYVSAQNSTEDMTTKRQGVKGEKRARIYLEDASSSKVVAQRDYVRTAIRDTQTLAKANGYKSWDCGVIVPFSVMPEFAQMPVKFLTLAPYPNTSSFYVVFTSAPGRNYSTEYLKKLIQYRGMMILSLIDSFLNGLQDLHGLTISRMKPREYPIVVHWYKEIFCPKYKALRTKQFTPFVDTVKSQKSVQLKESFKRMYELNMEKGKSGLKEEEALEEEKEVSPDALENYVTTWEKK